MNRDQNAARIPSGEEDFLHLCWTKNPLIMKCFDDCISSIIFIF